MTLVVGLAIGMVTSIFIARGLSAGGKGVYTLALLLPAIVLTFGSAGLETATIYFLGKNSNRREVYSNIFALWLLVSLANVIVTILVIAFFGPKIFPGVPQNVLYLAIALIPINLLITVNTSFMLGTKRVKTYNFYTLLQNILFLAIIATLFFTSGITVVVALWVEISTTIVAATIATISNHRFFGGFSWSLLGKSKMKEMISYGARLNITNMLSYILVRADTFMVNLYINPTAVGIYSIATSLAEKVWLLPRSIGTVLLPEVAGSGENSRQIDKFTALVMRITIVLSLAIAIPVAIVGRPLILWLYSSQFIGATIPLYILLLSTPLSSGTRIISNYFAGKGMVKEAVSASTLAILINIGLNFYFIPKFGIAGAAFTTLVSYVFNFGFRIIIFQKHTDISYGQIFWPQTEDWAVYRKTWQRLTGLVRKTS